MITIQQISGSGLSDLSVDEATFDSQTNLGFESFEYDGADWIRTTGGMNTTVDLTDFGVSYTGTPVSSDVIIIAHYWVFQARKGINKDKLNENFSTMQNLANSNETQINTIASTALHKSGDNLEQSAIDEFKKDDATILSTSGAVSLLDGGEYFLTPTGNVTITLPTITADQYSHTISLIVAGSQYIVDLGTTYSMLGPAIDTEQTYSVLFLYNKIDGHWYFFMGQ